jgi:hypothetical protein
MVAREGRFFQPSADPLDSAFGNEQIRVAIDARGKPVYHGSVLQQDIHLSSFPLPPPSDCGGLPFTGGIR